MKTIVLLALFAAITHASHLPEDWKSCKLSDPNRKVCLTEAVTRALSDLMDGNRELGIAPMDPMSLPGLTVNDEGFSLVMTDKKVAGLKRTAIKNIETDWKTMKVVAIIPEIRSVSNYKIGGKFRSIPIPDGEGSVELVAGNVHVVFTLKINENKMKGIVYNQIAESTLKLDIESLHAQFDQLGDNLNKEMNENWQDLWALIKGPLEKGWNHVFTHIAEKIFLKISKNELSPM